MAKNTGNDHAMSYVRKISLVAGSISALALMTTTKAAQAVGVTETQTANSGEITVDWDLDALEADDETLLASDTAGSDSDSDSGSDSDSDSGSDSDSDSESLETCEVTESNSDTCEPISDTSDTSDSDTSDTSDSDTSDTSDSDTSDDASGSDTSDTSGSDTSAESGALPSNRVVATEKFTFDIANASSNLVALSVASNW